MAIYLGNLSVEDMESRLGIELSAEDRNELKAMRQDDAQSVKDGRIHIFDIPLFVCCGGMDTCNKVYGILMGYEPSKFKEPIQLGLEND